MTLDDKIKHIISKAIAKAFTSRILEKEQSDELWGDTVKDIKDLIKEEQESE